MTNNLSFINYNKESLLSAGRSDKKARDGNNLFLSYNLRKFFIHLI